MKSLWFVWKSLRNNRLRTALTALGMAVAVFIFCFFQSVSHTMEGVVRDAGKNNNLVVMKENTW